MNHAPDLHTLTGAYAVHALDPEERARFEEHLAGCEACAQEVRELGAAAARLGEAEAVSPPPDLRRRVLAEIATVRQMPPQVPQTGLDERPSGVLPRLARQWPRLALAASVAGAAVLGGLAWQFHQDADRADRRAAVARQQQDDFARLMAAPDARTATARTGGASAAVVWSAGANRAAFLTSGLPHLPEGKVYELWYNDAGTMRPAGLLPPGGAARMLDGAVDGAAGIGVTVEPSGGSARPSGQPVLLLPFT
ncbi:anti-sigma factor [Streptacidiphilus sp. ASG 303]|uniref:anti-sigma factor n=1 Tax=Streptacidiphilus sp. ASG 303 TaxID=2896847 RepID=UPI001E2A3F50|nr:anti-sigma factor [Streptacidiphilus sp. ASG 303]MCD0485037.1 anti-sigma factor [Streptacidiphilus sp. ASG 303]